MATIPDLQQLVPTLPNAHRPLAGVITAGQPRPDDVGRLAAAGVTAVLDACAPEEPRGYDEPAVVQQAGLIYYNVPVRSYTPDDDTFDQVRALLRDPAQRPLLFHCRSANRVGGLLLPYLILDLGYLPDEALTLATQVGLRNPDLTASALAYVARHRQKETT